MAGHTRLDLGDVRRADGSVSVSPYVSVMSLLVDGVGGRRRGVPEAWRRALAGAVTRRSAAVVQSIVAPRADPRTGLHRPRSPRPT